jgi:hypothetical protein
MNIRTVDDTFKIELVKQTIVSVLNELAGGQKGSPIS